MITISPVLLTASSQIAKLIQFTWEYEQLGLTGAVWQDIEKICKNGGG